MQVPKGDSHCYVLVSALGSIRTHLAELLTRMSFPHAAVLGPVSDPMIEDVEGESMLDSVLPVYLLLLCAPGRVTQIHPRLPVRVYHPIRVTQGYWVLESLPKDQVVDQEVFFSFALILLCLRL